MTLLLLLKLIFWTVLISGVLLGMNQIYIKKKYLIKQLLTEVLSLQDRVDLQKFPVINKLTVGIQYRNLTANVTASYEKTIGKH